VKVLEAAGLIALSETRTTRNYTEKFYSATAPAFVIEQVVRAQPGPNTPPLVFASHDFALAILADGDDSHPRAATTAITGSLDSLIAVRQGVADVAGCHLLDGPSGEFNVPYVRHLFPDRSVWVVTLAHREQGLIVRPGNPTGVREIGDLASGVRFANRNRGSGTRVWLDMALMEAHIPHESVSGYSRELATHSQAADAVASGIADVALGIHAAAQEAGLDFIPLFSERYDLVIPAELHGDCSLEPLLDRLHSRSFRASARALRGYDTAQTGREQLLAV